MKSFEQYITEEGHFINKPTDPNRSNKKTVDFLGGLLDDALKLAMGLPKEVKNELWITDKFLEDLGKVVGQINDLPEDYFEVGAKTNK